MRRLIAGAALVAVAPLTLAGCGEDDPFAAYCEEVEAQQATLSEDLAGDEATGLIDALPEFERLADKAPSDLRDEWQTVISRIESLRDALGSAGVDAATYDRSEPPPGITAEEKDAIDAAAQALATPEMARALAGVEQQARDVCKTPLTL